MYRPPQNNNRVKSIRKKFENGENSKSPERKNGKSRNRDVLNSNISTTSNVNKLEVKFQNLAEIKQNDKQPLQRQLSDPSKRNVKRTPAFRVDKSAERTSAFQRNNINHSTLYESKVKQFSAVKYNCDSNSNLLVRKNETIPLSDNESENVPISSSRKPLLVKSKSSLDFQYVRSKFNKDITSCHDSTKKEDNSLDLSLLYTEPIPRALRRNNSNCTDNSNSPVASKKLENIYNASTLKISDIKKRESLTNSLKLALSRPLPKGPAPKKPPRTFQVLNLDNSPKNSSFLHTGNVEKKPLLATKLLKKADPKYMLIKLEDALRNNKLKARKQPRKDISATSGEDSDDSVLSRTKTNRTLPRLPSQEIDCDNTSAFNFNCLNGLRFSMTNYEKIKEPNSCFFVGNPEEPVYAEPYHYRKDSLDSAIIKREGSSRSKQSARNSLYYLSTPVLTTGAKFLNNSTENSNKPIPKNESTSSVLMLNVDNPNRTSPVTQTANNERPIFQPVGTVKPHLF